MSPILVPLALLWCLRAAPADTIPDAEARLERLSAALADAPGTELGGGEDARRHALAALAAETPAIPAEVLLGLAWRESHFHSDAGPMCGVDQVTLHGRACRALLAEGLVAEYRAGEAALERHLSTCRRMGRPTLRCALNSFAEGPAAGRLGWGVRGCKRRHCDRSALPIAHARRLGWRGGASARIVTGALAIREPNS